MEKIYSASYWNMLYIYIYLCKYFGFGILQLETTRNIDSLPLILSIIFVLDTGSVTIYFKPNL